MAFDTTALVTAIAEGRVDETEARQLLAESQELEVRIAKLLTPKSEVSDTEAVAVEPVHEPTPEELAQPEVPAEQAGASVTVTGEAEHVHQAVEGSTNCSCGLDITPQAPTPTEAPTAE